MTAEEALLVFSLPALVVCAVVFMAAKGMRYPTTLEIERAAMRRRLILEKEECELRKLSLNELRADPWQQQ